MLEDANGPLSADHDISSAHSLSSGKKSLQVVARIADRTDWDPSRSVAGALTRMATPEWAELIKLRGQRHHWLAGEVTPGVAMSPLGATIGRTIGTDGTGYIMSEGRFDSSTAADLALKLAADRSTAVMMQLGRQLLELLSATTACIESISHCARTPVLLSGRPAIPEDSENGKPFPYMVRVLIDDVAATPRAVLGGRSDPSALSWHPTDDWQDPRWEAWIPAPSYQAAAA